MTEFKFNKPAAKPAVAPEESLSKNAPDTENAKLAEQLNQPTKASDDFIKGLEKDKDNSFELDTEKSIVDLDAIDYITIEVGEEEGTLKITIDEDFNTETGPDRQVHFIRDYEFLFRKDFAHEDKPYRIYSINGGFTVNKAELDYIYNYFVNQD